VDKARVKVDWARFVDEDDDGANDPFDAVHDSDDGFDSDPDPAVTGSLSEDPVSGFGASLCFHRIQSETHT